MSKARITLALMALTLAGTTAWAQPEGSHAARKAAARAMGAADDSELQYVSWASTPRLSAYTGKRNGGFAITADNGRLLAYSETGSLPADEASAPKAFLSWLKLAREGAANAILIGEVTPIAGPGVLMETALWNQMVPYNLMCPKWKPNGEQTVTGCVATAMSIVMRYHSYPPSGRGYIEYDAGENVGELKRDLALDTYQWDAMSMEYAWDGSLPGAMDVAELMLDAGMAVYSEYGIGSTGGTAALDFNIAVAAQNNFGYDRSIRAQFADYMPRAMWKELVVDNLRRELPIVYCGADTDEFGEQLVGHCFVCDGFNTDGYFHINWGWGGTSNGWFDLDILSPKHAETGGVDGASYWKAQMGVLNMEPSKGNDSKETIALTLETMTALPGDDGHSLVVTLDGLSNTNPNNFEGTIYMRFNDITARDRSRSITGNVPILTYTKEEPLMAGWTVIELPQVVLTGADLGGKAGEYEIELWAVNNEGTEQQFWAYLPDINKTTFTMAPDATFSAPETDALLSPAVKTVKATEWFGLDGLPAEQPAKPGVYVATDGSKVAIAR